MATLILDERRPVTRWLDARWRRWDARPPAWLPAAARVTEPVRRRLLARRLARRPAPPQGVLVVSVGNLALGGTGKTPVTIALAAALRRRGMPVAVATRGHGSPVRGPVRVDPRDARLGDEARLMAAALPDVPVIQGRDRAAGLAAAAAAAPGGVVLLEDGHQAAAGRHLDLLLLDRWTEAGGTLHPAAGRPLPWGPYREPAAGAARAAAWLLPLPPGAPFPAARAPVPLFGFRSRTAPPDPAVAPLPAGRYGLLAGIARPERLLAACDEALGRPPAVAVWCDDHARHGPRRLARLARLARRHDLAAWVTTGKDAVKLGGGDLPVPLVVLRQELAWEGPDDPAAWLRKRWEQEVRR